MAGRRRRTTRLKFSSKLYTRPALERAAAEMADEAEVELKTSAGAIVATVRPLRPDSSAAGEFKNRALLYSRP